MIRQVLRIGSPGSAPAPRRWRASRVALAPLAITLAAGIHVPSTAEPASLAGSWRGGGWVSFSSGAKEKAHCRALYKRASKDSYTVRATCATSSGRASQTATVYRVSDGRYRGSFYNTEYNIRGTIRVVVSGSSQSVNLAGDGASASLSLTRR